MGPQGPAGPAGATGPAGTGSGGTAYQFDPHSFYLDNTTTPPTVHWTGSYMSPIPYISQSPPFVLQPNGIWLLAGAPIPVNPWGGSTLGPGAFVVLRNGAIVAGYPVVPAEKNPLFQLVIVPEGGDPMGPFDIQIVPTAQTTVVTGSTATVQYNLGWPATDTVRVLWASSQL